MSHCGKYLSKCRCVAPVLRTPDEVAAAHEEAVKRAQRHGWGSRPTPRWVVGVLWPDVYRDHEKVA